MKNFYEFTVKIVHDTGEARVRQLQVPAYSEVEAAIEVGRVYNKEYYEVILLECKKVQ